MKIEITEQQGKNVLLLEDIEPRKLWSKGPKMYYRLIHRWLRDENDTTSVLGSDDTYWTKKEGLNMIKTGLFNNVNLF